MIGVLAKTTQTRAVEEFFELFKTPWEVYQPDREYDVVVATVDDIPRVSAKLLIVYGPARKNVDADLGIGTRALLEPTVLNERGTPLPIYGRLLTFSDDRCGILTASSGETAGLALRSPDCNLTRLGYDLFDEVSCLLSNGQPIQYAHIPTLEIHIRMLRQWILDAGLPLLEIPPVPARHGFIVCLTHDIDFAGIRQHFMDHSMWGFVYRATFGSLYNFGRRRISFTQLLRCWQSVASLPFVYIGWTNDFWEPFEWYLKAERDLAATYFLVPFKKTPGDNVPGHHASWRGTAYDVRDILDSTDVLLNRGCEVGVHGIDAWHSAEKGIDERLQIVNATGDSNVGIRIHWLLHDGNTPSVLEKAGYAYDSTCGYNEAVGYRAGTSQVFRPSCAQKLLELPLHIQDGALFFPERLDLSKPEAEKRCQDLVDNAREFGGVLTVLWHDRSHGPERFWGDFYLQLLQSLRSLDCWFGTAAQVVDWFRRRREVRFVQAEDSRGVHTHIRYSGENINPLLRIRLYKRRHETVATSPEFIDIPWDGQFVEELEHQIALHTQGQYEVCPLP